MIARTASNLAEVLDEDVWIEDRETSLGSTSAVTFFPSSHEYTMKTSDIWLPLTTGVVLVSGAYIDPTHKDVYTEKYLWNPETPLNLAYSFGTGHQIIEAGEELIGFPGDVTASMSIWPELWQHPESERDLWRGVFSLPRKRSVLFSKRIEFKVSELPRRKRNVSFYRTIEMEREGD